MKVLWAVKNTDPDWCETILTEKQEEIPAVMEWAKQNGYDRFRVAIYSDIPETPDFVKTINPVRKWGKR